MTALFVLVISALITVVLVLLPAFVIQAALAARRREQERRDVAEWEAEQAQRRGEPAAEEGGRAITLAQRAHPLLEMLRAAQSKRVDVTWGV